MTIVSKQGRHVTLLANLHSIHPNHLEIQEKGSVWIPRNEGATPSPICQDPNNSTQEHKSDCKFDGYLLLDASIAWFD